MYFTEKINRFVDEILVPEMFSGILRVTEKEKVIFERFVGFADRERKIPLTEKSVFSFYSLSKPFCAIGLLRLKDMGLVDIKKHPGEYIKEAQNFDDSLTIEHLLRHESGLPDFFRTDEFVKKHMPGTPKKIREHIKLLQKFPARFKPGDEVYYANVNFNLCAVIIENVTGEKYADYMMQEVFKLLGMSGAQVDNINLDAENRVTGYIKKDGKITPSDRVLDWMMGAGDIIGTADDVYCLGKAIKNKTLLNEHTWTEVLTPSGYDRDFGFGCKVKEWLPGKKSVTHNGGFTGFRTMHDIMPEDDLDIIYLSNCDYVDGRRGFFETVYNAYYNRSFEEIYNLEMDKGYI